MNRSKVRDPRFWRRWATSGATDCPTWHAGNLRTLAGCARSWARVDTSKARRGDSFPVYAAAAPVDLAARCRRVAMQHGGALPGVCRTCGARFGGCTACYLSGRAPGTPEFAAAREMVRAKLGDDAVALWAQWAKSAHQDR